MTILFSNNATSRLQIATPAASGTITLPSGEGAQFPAPGAGDSFLVTIEDRRTGQMEICRCTSRVADVLTVTRALEGTVAQDFLVGATVSNRMTAGTLAILQEAYLKPEADAKFVDAAGDTMTGPLVLSADPASGSQAARKSYVDAQVATRALTVHTHPMTDVTGLVTALAGKEAVAPTDGAFYGRMATSWTTPGIAQITGLQAALNAKLEDAPSDSVIYGRRNAIWTAVVNDWSSITGKPPTFPPTLPIQEIDVVNLVADLAARITDAPTDGAQYARAAGAWAVVTGGGSGGGIPEAPTDGQLYGRKSSNWFVVPASPTWSTLTGKPSTFPPTVPIAQADITNLVSDQAAQNTAIGNKEPIINAGTTAQFWRGDKTWQALSSITVDAYTKAESDARFEPIITAGTTAQYWKGNKTWATLDKAAVGLGNVDNTADTAKPVSTAQAAADALRVLKAGDTMSGVLTMPAGSAAAPSINFGSTNSGFYGAGNVLFASAAGNRKLTIDAASISSDVPINLPADPTTALQAATKQYVDNKPAGGVTCSATAPGSPVDGQLWWNSDLAILLVRYNDGTTTQWVQIG